MAKFRSEKVSDFDKDTYQTPKYLFNWLNKRFNFNLDGCANSRNALCYHYIGEGAKCTDFLTFNPREHENRWSRPRIFVNPPYSKPLPFVQRAAELKQAGYLVVMLLPADKSTKWYGVIQQHATEVIDIIGGRVNFIHPVTGEEAKGNNKGSMIAVFDPFVEGLVTRQVSLDFIKQWGER